MWRNISDLVTSWRIFPAPCGLRAQQTSSGEAPTQNTERGGEGCGSESIKCDLRPALTPQDSERSSHGLVVISYHRCHTWPQASCFVDDCTYHVLLSFVARAVSWNLMILVQGWPCPEPGQPRPRSLLPNPNGLQIYISGSSICIPFILSDVINDTFKTL